MHTSQMGNRMGMGNSQCFQMGNAGTGMVWDFDTPQHTVYPYHGVVGMHGDVLSLG